MAPCRAMICQQVTLSGGAEWPKVADAVIEALFLLTPGRGRPGVAFSKNRTSPCERCCYRRTEAKPTWSASVRTESYWWQHYFDESCRSRRVAASPAACADSQD